MVNNEKLSDLKQRLEDLRKRNPAHFNMVSGFNDHSVSPELFQEIEELEEEIKKLEGSADNKGVKQ